MRRSFLALLCLSPFALAQTYVVDANGGGNFTDLPAAVAAVPSGATLRVANGLYSPFTLANKSLTIVSSGGRVRMSSDVVIGPIAANESVRISGLALGSLLAPSALRIQDCAGSVVVDDCIVFSFGNPPVRVDVLNSPSVHLLRFLFDTTNVGHSQVLPTVGLRNSTAEIARSRIFGCSGLGSSPNGGPGIAVEQGSTLSLVSSTVVGGRGVGSSGPPAGHGGPGILVSGGSVLQAYGGYDLTLGSFVLGGPGGLGFGTLAGNGGDGCVVRQGSAAVVLEMTLSGGQAGSSSTTNGNPSAVDPSSTLGYDPNARTPWAILDGNVTPQATVRYTLLALPGTPAILLASFDFTALSPAPLALGLLGVTPTLVLGPLRVPPNGRLEVPSLVPAWWPAGTFLGAQFVTLDPLRNRFEVSNTITAVAR